jgi:S-formylglutathione hydrolase FrmB
MLHWVLAHRIDTGTVFDAAIAVAVIAAASLLLHRPLRRRLPVALAGAAAGCVVGIVAGWLASDVFNVLDASFSYVTRTWIALGFAGIGLAAVSAWRARWWRIVIAAVSIPVFLATAAIAVNDDVGLYRTVDDALGVTGYHAVALPRVTSRDPAPRIAQWTPPRDMPGAGVVEQVRIPGLTSHFTARPADLYLPPAARVSNGPALPVIIALSGQPGYPWEMFVSGNARSIADAYAAAHHGLAPIVISPDQLGEYQNNPMCVNSPLGNSATYITVDVVNWVKTHLHVLASPHDWGVVGFSQGATCAVQFAAAYPHLFGVFGAIASELGPTMGPDTITLGFHGSHAAYNAAQPVTLFAEHRPYADMTGMFAYGEFDGPYAASTHVLVAAARKAGVHTSVLVWPGGTHSWRTTAEVLTTMIPAIADGWGLNR